MVKPEPVYVDGVLVYYRYRGYALWKFLREEWQVFGEGDFLGKPLALNGFATLEHAVEYVDGRCG